jgi:hypothetical protein
VPAIRKGPKEITKVIQPVPIFIPSDPVPLWEKSCEDLGETSPICYRAPCPWRRLIRRSLSKTFTNGVSTINSRPAR